MTNQPSDKLAITTIERREISPEAVEAEARRFAMKTGGILRMAMAEQRLTDDMLASMLEVSKKQIQNQTMGEGWRAYLPLAALCLALGLKMDLRTDHL